MISVGMVFVKWWGCGNVGLGRVEMWAWRYGVKLCCGDVMCGFGVGLWLGDGEEVREVWCCACWRCGGG